MFSTRGFANAEMMYKDETRHERNLATLLRVGLSEQEQFARSRRSTTFFFSAGAWPPQSSSPVSPLRQRMIEDICIRNLKSNSQNTRRKLGTSER